VLVEGKTTRWPRERTAVEHVELETLKWVGWFANERLHEPVDDMTP